MMVGYILSRSNEQQEKPYAMHHDNVLFIIAITEPGLQYL